MQHRVFKASLISLMLHELNRRARARSFSFLLIYLSHYSTLLTHASVPCIPLARLLDLVIGSPHTPSEVTMKSLLRCAPLFLFILLAPSSICAQAVTSMGVNLVNHTATFSASLGPSIPQPVVGVPLSYERVFDYSQLLADGTRITDKTVTSVFYRDSSGRTRTERSVFQNHPPSPELSGVKLIEIRDPNAGVQYVFATQNRLAYRLPLSAGPPQPIHGAAWVEARSATTASDNSEPEVTKESLGTQVMEGVSVEGRRITRVFPIGSMNNDRPITETVELWYSPDLDLTVLSKVSSLANGDQTNRITNISRTEPDPALFQVPSGYQIVDGPADGRVTFKFDLPRH